MNIKPIETLGGYFIAISDDKIRKWLGALSVSVENYDLVGECSAPLEIIGIDDLKILVFGGDITSIEVVKIDAVDILVRRIYSEGSNLENLVNGIVMSELNQECLEFYNESNKYIIFDSAYPGNYALEEKCDTIEWNIPTGKIRINTFLYSDDSECFYLHYIAP